MAILIWAIALLINSSLLGLYQASKAVWGLSLAIFLGVLFALLHLHFLQIVQVLLFYAVLMVFCVWGPLRRLIVMRAIFALYRRKAPKLSATEQVAMDAGTVSWDGELFSGLPSAELLKSYPKSVLTAEEQAFLAGPVEDLCAALDPWAMQHQLGDLPQQAWQIIKEQGFFGIIIPKEYGGYGFSAYAHSRILVKISSVSPAAAVTVAVPNSLGPAELLLHYGTQTQKDYYLPRLASGQELPCFALTSPVAGSDATSIVDSGVVCEEMIKGEKVLGIRLNWDKRYITLAPVATLIGLAFKLFDPDHLLGNQENLGITCALIPRETEGITIGRRHLTNQVMFQNGPIQGQDVFVSLEAIIGGAKGIGQGWKMLVDCLSAGRAISIPSMGIGGLKAGLMYVGAYARIRRQFKQPLVNFQGIQEALAPMAGLVYMADALESLATSLIDTGEKPSVISAIVKYQISEMARQSSLASMDILGGKALCIGEQNPVSAYYAAMPIGITVEGAGILTRCLVIFGQGLFRCHPYLFKEMQCAAKAYSAENLLEFDRCFLGHLKHIMRVKAATLWGGLSQGKMLGNEAGPFLEKEYQQLSRYSSVFAYLVEVLAIVYGAGLKRKEFISGRMADILGALLCFSAVLKKFHDAGNPEVERCVLDWSCQTLAYQIEESLAATIANMPIILRSVLRALVFPLGRRAGKPSDSLEKNIALSCSEDTPLRRSLLEGAYSKDTAHHIAGKINAALPLFSETESLWQRLMKDPRETFDPRVSWAEVIDKALTTDKINADEAQKLHARERYRQEFIAVSDYSQAELSALLLDAKKMAE